MKKSVLLLTFLSLVLFSCKNVEEHSNREALPEEHVSYNHSQAEAHWTYQGETGPEHWAEIEKNSDCNGTRQSPINIIDFESKHDPNLKPIEISYSNKVKIHDVTNNGHSIQYNFEKGDYIVVDGKTFELKQIHFHEASEHTINGVRYPLEMHLVHVSDDQQIAVLGVMAEEGGPSEPFTFLENYLPVQIGETKAIDAFFDLNLNLPDSREYYTYAGSLTTPPCTENVQWYVFKTPITISLDQVKQLQELMPINNYRNEQPLNDRVVTHYTPSH